MIGFPLHLLKHRIIRWAADVSTTWRGGLHFTCRNLSPSARVAVRIQLFPLVGSAAILSTWMCSSLFMQKHVDGLGPPPSWQTNHRGCDRQLQDFTSCEDKDTCMQCSELALERPFEGAFICAAGSACCVISQAIVACAATLGNSVAFIKATITSQASRIEDGGFKSKISSLSAVWAELFAMAKLIQCLFLLWQTSTSGPHARETSVKSHYKTQSRYLFTGKYYKTLGLYVKSHMFFCWIRFCKAKTTWIERKGGGAKVSCSEDADSSAFEGYALLCFAYSNLIPTRSCSIYLPTWPHRRWRDLEDAE